MVGGNIANPTTSIEVKPISKKTNRATSEVSLVVFVVCLVAAISAMFLLLVVNAWKRSTKKISTTQSLGLIPCQNCQFFKGSKYLKCAVHPATVLTKQAIDCLDYQPRKSHG